MNIEETIQQVENLYERITGQQVPQGEIKYPVTSNVDPLLLIETRYQELMQRLQDPQIRQRLEPWTPALSVWETEESIFVRVDLPQVKKEDIDISFRGNVLMIAGTRRNFPTTNAMIPKMNETVFAPGF
jgi:HSP20 family molecular chaperone IbpA